MLASHNHAKPHTLAHNSGEHSDNVGGATQHPANMKSRHTTPARCKAKTAHQQAHIIARNPAVQLHPEHSRNQVGSWEQSVTMGSAQGAARSGPHLVKNSPFDHITQSCPMGRGEVAAALKGPVITPEGMVEWRRAAAAPRRRPTMNKSPRKICSSHAIRKSIFLKRYPKST